MAQFDHEGRAFSKCASAVGCFISERMNMPHVCWHVDISQAHTPRILRVSGAKEAFWHA